MTDDRNLRFPIGQFNAAQDLSVDQIAPQIDTIAATPGRLRDAVTGLSDAQLDTPYRPEGWGPRQVVHHVADSHMNSYVRFKLAMTEDVPTIRPYFEDRWGELPDAVRMPVDVSLNLLDALHERWAWFLRQLTPEDYQRRFRHPEMGELSVGLNICFYAWHGEHHVAHITSLREREGW